MNLSIAQERMLWECAQHKYGWAHIPTRRNGRSTADVLVCLGLGAYGRNGRDHAFPKLVLAPAGRALVARRWPVTPAMVGSYELPDGERAWSSEPDPRYCDDGRDFVPGVGCGDCGRFVGRDGSIELGYFEMSNQIAYVEGTCRRCSDGAA
jgi:hypothetical protein